MKTLPVIPLRNYRQLHIETRNGKDSQPYLVLKVHWRKPDGSVVQLGAIALYPRHVESLLPELKSFHQTFSSQDRPRIAFLPMKEAFDEWLARDYRRAFYVYREVSKRGENHAVIAFHPKAAKSGSAIWIHEADLPKVIALFESTLKPEKPPTIAAPPPTPSKTVSTTSHPMDDGRERFNTEESDYEAQLQELDETLKNRHEFATQQYDEDERTIEEGWPYPDEDEE